MNERVTGALCALAIIAVAAIFYFVVMVGGPHAAHSLRARGQTLPAWSSNKIRAQMGEANQVVDGSALGLPQGVTCRIWFQQARALILCTA